MPEQPRATNNRLPLSLQERLARLRLGFEDAWQQGPAPRIEMFLADGSESERSFILSELLKLDLSYRRRQGPPPTVEEYRQRFPQHDALIQAAFADVRAAPAEEAVPSEPPRMGVLERGTAVKSGRAGAVPARLPSVPGYEVLDELGRGGMGVVYRARQTKLQRLVALKMILAGGQASPQDLSRFQIEAQAVGRMQHPGIVQIHEVGAHEGRPFFSLEFVEGGSLADLLEGEPWPARRAVQLVEKLAQATHHAHQHGVIHRDLKPANVLLTKDGQPKITDFGLAKHLEADQQLSRSGAVMGTPSYMAPEQAAGKLREIGPATDVYALGAILYELLTGRPPFRGPTPAVTVALVLLHKLLAPAQLNPEVPRDLETICLHCLHKEPTRRYRTAAHLADDLQRFLLGEPIAARPVGRVERAVKWVRRRPAVAALLAGLLLVTMLGVSGIMWLYFDAEAHRQKAEGLAEDFRIKKEEAERLAQEFRKKTADEAKARGEARQAEQHAKNETKRALDQEAWARKELARAEGLLYASQLTQAQLLWQDGNAEAARDVLASCRWDYRGWEHAHLRHRFDETALTIRGKIGGLAGLRFSPDGKRLAGAGSDAVKVWVKVWDAATGEQLLTRTVKDCDLVSLSPDGKRLAARSRSSPTAKVYDVSTGHLLVTIEGCGGLRFGPDGKHLAGGDVGGQVHLWDSVTGKKVRTLAWRRPHILITRPIDVPGRWVDPEAVNSVCFSPDGKRIASALGNGTVELWDVVTGKELRILKGHAGEIHSACFGPDGKQLASASADGTVRVWDTVTGQAIGMMRGHAQDVLNVVFSPDGNRLAGVGRDGIIHLWDALTGQEVGTLRGHVGAVEAVFSADGKRLASGSGDGTVKIWDAAGDQGFLTLAVNAPVTSVVFSSDGRRLASADSKWVDGFGGYGGYSHGEVKIWDAASGRQLLMLKTQEVKSVAFSPDGKRLAGGAKVWDTATGKELLTLKGQTGRITSVVFSGNGKRLALGSGELTNAGAVTIWDAGSGQHLRTLKGHTNMVTSVAFSPDDRWLVSGSYDKTVKFWDAASGQELRTLKGHTSYVSSVAFSADGKLVASGSYDNTVKVWEAASGQELRTLKGHTSYVESVAFSADGKLVASGSVDKTVKVWDAATGLELLTLKGHTDIVRSVAFSGDSQRLASGAADKTVKVWEAAGGQDIRTLRGHTRDLTRVGFSPDSKRIISQSKEGETRSWNARTGQEIVPCADPPPGAQREAISLDGKLRIWADGNLVRAVRTDDRRPSSDLVCAERLNDNAARLRWHRDEAADSEAKEQWFAAAFHLRQLLAAQEPDQEQLRKRMKICQNQLGKPRR